jgi:hypothetical protein
MADAILYQNPAESLPYTFDFSPYMPNTDAALNDVSGGTPSTITAAKYDGTDVSSTILSNKTRTALTLIVTIAALTEGEEYLVTFKGIGATSAAKKTLVLQVLARAKIGSGF